MLVIRLSRAGAKKRPFYHVVVTDKRSPRDGRFKERLGYFNPMARGKDTSIALNMERVQHWINNGAQPSDRVKSLIKSHSTQASA